MCGIIGYVGIGKAEEVLLDGLETLEYRGYDSAGIFMPRLGVVKAVGAVKNLRALIVTQESNDSSGIGHTRWATHGKPSNINAHPHTGIGKVWLVHNGIIENYKELKTELVQQGRVFRSDTDTEVIPHLIESFMERGETFEKAVFMVLPKLKGTYGLAIMHVDIPEKILIARMGSPLVIGISKNGRFVASDISPLLRHTRDVVYMKDGDVAFITKDSHEVFSLTQEKIDRKEETVAENFEEAKKGGYEFFMEKEIMESPEVVQNALRGRIIMNDGRVKLAGLEVFEEKLRTARRIVLVGCGTSYHAALVGKYLIENLSRVSVEVEIGSELRYREPVFTPDTILVALSQSGETADTLEALRDAKRKGIFTFGIVNVVGSSIARETDAGIFTHAGPEVSVASTKAFISQVVTLTIFAIFLGSQRGLSLEERKKVLKELDLIPKKIELILKSAESIKKIAEIYSLKHNALFIGRKYMLPLAYEGALKLKEVSYVHAEGYGAGELKHGSLALVEKGFPVIALIPRDSVYEKMLSNIQEVRAREGDIISIITMGDFEAKSISTHVIEIPETVECLYPILAAIPVQLLAYYTALHRGLDVDHPRNLAKSVTVE